MKIPGRRHWRRVKRRLKNSFFPGALILVYHRVAEVDSDPWSLCVTPQHFAEQLEVLRSHTRCLQLQQLTQAITEKKSLHRAVAITFDDGYADNLYNAKPLLERYNIPATVFVTTGNVGQKREFWWDELERLLLQPGTLPEKLQLSINGNNYEWELGEEAHYTEEAYQRHRHWYVDQPETPNPRHFLYRSLWQLLRPLPESDRRQLLDQLIVSAKAEPTSRSTHHSLSLTEVLTLAQGELIEVGAHTVTHPLLSALPVAVQQAEIQQSKAWLEVVLGRQISSFAYPYGEYTAATIAAVQEAGFACACSSMTESVQRHSNCFQLPRVQVQDWSGEEFSKRLSRWFDV